MERAIFIMDETVIFKKLRYMKLQVIMRWKSKILTCIVWL